MVIDYRVREVTYSELRELSTGIRSRQRKRQSKGMQWQLQMLNKPSTTIREVEGEKEDQRRRRRTRIGSLYVYEVRHARRKRCL